MHETAMSDGGGSGVRIDVNPDEITSIYKFLEEILTELETNASPNIEKLGNLHYYTEGKAKKAMEVYAEANQKVMDLYDNYTRASTLVIDILNTMIQVDEEIAKKIIAKLGV
ncbi:hypothetical protein B5V88_10825 [Heyndrickxia sporothermodurans]|uniref:Uncharacterized protein n=1 Tax=Heyndrickxia sporothermodurans TaxID=46224 RepID=A0AB37HNU0_9BACI|nr:hypothetical protein [Heyndrickxia sporothermodurans]MBL5768612.1 hypothetical protein [Heyndrickxia sporothermodurans]MBL5772320.1 hypothetical protein [Heyndrickxia sporothermodurans]MBL5775885.1 hypothetical protein [Heyndrickxia sporothermodurans]MBL5779393.1 hypothetical protein [Heyndrickxia sporothermodurans]MBL5782987.1 hypothetical protein [Heyndrickxia sporothermodurans]